MAIVRWDPARLSEPAWSRPGFGPDVNRIFDAFFNGRTGGDAGGHRGWIPAMDLVETDEGYVMRADLPGVKEEDVKVEIKDDVLTVSGERKAEHERKENGYHRVERSYGHFARSIRLPQGVDEAAVTGSYENGVLEVRIPRPEEPQATRVEINSGSKQPEAIEGTGQEK